MTRLKRTCYICGTKGEVTKDHIPPRRFYPQDIQNKYQLITVSCCKKCHEQFSEDDHYLRTVLNALTDETVNHPVAIENRESIKRALEKPELASFCAEIAKSMVRVWRQSKGGIWIRRYRLMLDYPKLYNLFSRYVRGLFHRERDHKKVMDSDVHFALLVPDDYGRERRETIYQHLGFMLEYDPVVKHGDVFEYRSLYFNDNITHPHSAWQFRFYDAHDFFVLVYSNEYKGPDGQLN